MGIQRRPPPCRPAILGKLQLDTRLGHRRGTPWFDGQWTGYDPAVGFPGYRYGVTTLDVSAGLPFALGPVAMSWDSSLHAQTSPQLLLGSEFITLGGRYSVRGFDGERTLGAERGAYWRNSLNLPVQRLGTHLGVDAGRPGSSRSSAAWPRCCVAPSPGPRCRCTRRSHRSPIRTGASPASRPPPTACRWSTSSPASRTTAIRASTSAATA
ncbi:ShlB/FhaC/HecB family hemolysin secretion/activation protein [Pantoea ananatis]|uniref:ShlB/FhaC/HecB family hemolysin secretion/activation protein n=1 Tax=Pantoea ananas TaxID=553 RepID=UPI0039B962AB